MPDSELGGTAVDPDVPDEVDELVEASLKANRRGRGPAYLAVCDRCKGEWHGFARRGCPGAIGKPSSV